MRRYVYMCCSINVYLYLFCIVNVRKHLKVAGLSGAGLGILCLTGRKISKRNPNGEKSGYVLFSDLEIILQMYQIY